jgi:hypothetical protein
MAQRTARAGGGALIRINPTGRLRACRRAPGVSLRAGALAALAATDALIAA